MPSPRHCRQWTSDPARPAGVGARGGADRRIGREFSYELLAAVSPAPHQLPLGWNSKELTEAYVEGFKKRQGRQRDKEEREKNGKLKGRPPPDFEKEAAKRKFLTSLHDAGEIIGDGLNAIEPFCNRLNLDDWKEIEDAWTTLEHLITSMRPSFAHRGIREAAE